MENGGLQASIILSYNTIVIRGQGVFTCTECSIANVHCTADCKKVSALQRLLAQPVDALFGQTVKGKIHSVLYQLGCITELSFTKCFFLQHLKF